ncbi:MAG: chorismate mutase [Erysipelotrichaceae bacterium]|nr:chorismate mutase [Erysipelotrichaceae bacterium]
MELDEMRVQLNGIDDQLKALFLERMQIVKKIGDYKIANDLPTYDPSREEAMAKRLSADLEGNIRELYLEFLKNYVSLSRKYQDSFR